MSLSALCFSAHIDWNSLQGPVAAELEATLDRARKLNRLNGVTGALLLSRDAVIVWIEGDAKGLADTFDCVSRDPRLNGMEIIARGEIPQRVFSRCWLYLADLRDQADASTEALFAEIRNGAPDIEAVAAAVLPVTDRLVAARQTQRAILV
jgi:hypothetical protein